LLVFARRFSFQGGNGFRRRLRNSAISLTRLTESLVNALDSIAGSIRNLRMRLEILICEIWCRCIKVRELNGAGVEKGIPCKSDRLAFIQGMGAGKDDISPLD